MTDETNRPDDEDDETGAEGGHSESTDRAPGAPADDDAPVGDTDQHSDADA
jgi:hypothetical protein